MSTRIRLVFACLAVTAVIALAWMPTAALADASGVKGEITMWIKDAEEKLVELSEAVPEKKYAWSPAKGVRSVGEIYMHVAAANYGVPSFLGVTAPEGFNFMTYEKSLTKKSDIRKALKDSFEHVRSSLDKMSDEDLEQPVEFFGMKTTKRGGYMLLLSHAHEHLGQSIAYARSSGIAPPWTARNEAAMKAMMEKEKNKEGSAAK